LVFMPAFEPIGSPSVWPTLSAVRGRLHERFLQLGQLVRHIELADLGVDVEAPLDQLDFTDRRRPESHTG
jgi:hypothetical protein